MAHDRHLLPDQIWFDPANPEPLHDALRLDFVRVQAAAQRRPSLRRHMQDCSVCQAIAAATAGAPNPISTRKRLKVVLSKQLMHQLLRLPAHFEIVHMFSENDPNAVMVMIAGEGLPETSDDQEVPIGPLAAVMQDPTNTAS